MELQKTDSYAKAYVEMQVFSNETIGLLAMIESKY